MTGHVAAIEAVEDVLGKKPNALDLQMLTAQSRLEELQGVRFSQMAEKALTSAIERPHTPTPLNVASDELSQSGAGAVGLEKTSLVANADAVSDPTSAGATESDALATQQEDRIKALYLDLTNYQIAWKIAQRLQQDITQLMKGS